MAGPELTARPARPTGVAALPPILCYHKVDTRFELGFTQIEPRVFRRQVESLARAGYRTVGAAELAERLSGGAAGAGPPAPAGPEIVLTFDDGYAGLARHAFPVLADHGFRPLVFVISDYVGRENSWDVQYGWRRFAHLDWDELAVWRQRAGLEVHSHGATHARLTWLGDAQALDELERSRETIAARLGAPPIAVSYPFGSVDARVMGLSARAGFRLGFTGPTRAAPQPLALPRLPVYGWDAGARPLVLGGSPLSAAGLALARITNRCAVGTAAIQRLLGRRYGRGVRA